MIKMKLRSGKITNVQTSIPKPAIFPKPPTPQQIQNVIVASRPFQQPSFYKVETKKECGHECCLWVKDKCCECIDKRPILEDTRGYRAYNNANLFDYSNVSRHYYYCGKCKDRLNSVKDIEIAQKKIAELEKKVAELEKKNAELEKKNAELQKKDAQKKSDEAERNLWNSGLETLCYHLGYCSDVMSDWWFPIYEEKGLLYLKSQLWNESKEHHKGNPCKECEDIIMGVSD